MLVRKKARNGRAVAPLPPAVTAAMDDDPRTRHKKQILNKRREMYNSGRTGRTSSWCNLRQQKRVHYSKINKNLVDEKKPSGEKNH